MADLLSAPEYERILLGLAIAYPDLIPVLLERPVRALHFEARLHRQLWQAIVNLYSAGAPVELTTVAATLAPADAAALGGLAGLASLYDGVASPDAHGQICDLLDDRARRRRMYALADKIRAATFDPDQDSRLLAARAKIALEAMEREAGGEATAAQAGYVLAGQLAAILAAEHAQEPDITSGFAAIDAYLATGGLARKNLSAVGGRTGMGKTNYALQMAFRNGRRGRRGIYFSLEMSREELVQRWIAQTTGIEFTKILKPWLLDQSEKNNITMTVADLQSLPIVIDDRAGISYREIGAVCAKEKRGAGLDFAVVDHLQLVSGPEKGESGKRQTAGRASDYLKEMAKELDIHVMELSQLPRPSNKQSRDFRPQLWDYKESGDIENSLDLGAFVHREGYYDAMTDQGIAEFIIRKQRNGPIGTAMLQWDASCVRFR